MRFFRAGADPALSSHFPAHAAGQATDCILHVARASVVQLPGAGEGCAGARALFIELVGNRFLRK